MIICDNCGRRGARVKKIAKTYGKGRNLFIVRNIPVVSCPRCGESYLESATLHAIQRIKTHHNNLAVERKVGIVNFAQAS